MKHIGDLAAEYASKHFNPEIKDNWAKYDIANKSFTAGFNQAMRILMDVGNILDSDWRVEKNPEIYLNLED